MSVSTVNRYGANAANPKSYTIGKGGDFLTIESAVSSIGTVRYVARRGPETAVITTSTATNSLAAVGTNWQAGAAGTSLTGNGVRVGDFVKLSDNAIYFRIQKVTSDTQLYFYENFNQTLAGVSKTFSFYYLDTITLILLPGTHTVNNTFSLPHGYNIVGTNSKSCILNETVSGRVFNTVGECNFENLTFGPSLMWNALDGICSSPDSTTPAGAEITYRDIYIRSGNSGDHGGSNFWHPIYSGSITNYENVTFDSGGTSAYGTTGGSVTASNTNTICNFKNCTGFFTARDDISVTNSSLFGVSILSIATLGTYNIIGGNYYTKTDLTLTANATLNRYIAGINIMAAAIINIKDTKISVTNTDPSAQVTYGVSISSAGAGAIVNIQGGEVEGFGAAGSAGAFNGAIATLNIRTGSRVTGTTNSVNAIVGSTVNTSPNADLILATTGAGTFNATAT